MSQPPAEQTLFGQPLDTLAQTYQEKLVAIEGGYERLTAEELEHVAYHDMALIAQALDQNDPSPFLEWTRERVIERLDTGFEIETLLQALAAIEDTLLPWTDEVDSDVTRTLWQMMRQARNLVTEMTMQQLRESEFKFRQLVDRSPVGIFRTTPDGQITEANPTFLRIVDYKSLKEINRVGVANLYQDPVARERVLKLLQTGPVSGFETTFKQADGEPVPVSISVRLVEEKDDHFLEGIIEDITERKQAQEALKESEERFRSIVENSHAGIFIVDQAYQFTYANDQLCEILGYPRRELIGMDFRQVLDEESRRLASERYVRRQKGEPVPPRYEVTLIRKDGEKRRGELSATITQDSTGNVQTIAQLLDITERKQAEEDLRQLARAVSATHDAVVITDPDGIIQFVNPAFQEITGYSQPEALGQNPRILKSGLQPDEFYADMWQTISKGQVWQGDVTNRRKDDSLYEAQLTISPMRNEAGEIDRFVAIQRDITERKQAEHRLRAQQTFLRQVIDSTPNFIFVRDREGRFVLANQAIAEAYGTTVQGLTGKTDADFNPDPERVEQALRDDRAVMDALQDKVSYESSIVDFEGNVRWLQITKRPLVDEDGVARRVLGVAADITERKQLELERQQMYERRTQQVQTSTQVAQEIAAAPALDELFRRVVTLIKERFDYYHAQIFRYEPSLDAVVLVVGYGETGEQMLEAGHRLELGRGVVGTAAVTGQAVLVNDVTQDPDWVPNPFLPDAQGELAVPIKLQDEVLGILDVQSDTAHALTEEDQIMLEGLCGQIAIAIDSTRLRQEAQAQLRELNALYRATTREGWQATAQTTPAYMFDRDTGLQPVPDLSMPPIQEALESESPTRQEDVLAVPLLLRGEPIGTIGVYDDPKAPISPQELELVQTIAEQAAQALEGARLFEQARTRAEELSVLNQLAQALTATLNLEEVLQETYEWTSRLMDTSNFYIGLYDPEKHEIAFALNLTDSEIEKEITVLSADQGITGYIVRNRTDVLIKDDIPAWLQEHGIKHVGQTAASWLGVPMMVGDQVLGVIIIQDYTTPNLYDEHDQDLLTAIASQTAIALQNARLFQETQTALNAAEGLAQELTVLNELGQTLTTRLEIDQVLREAYRQASFLVDTTNFFIGLYDQKNDEIVFHLDVSESQVDQEITRLPADQGISGYIVRERTSVLFEDNVRERQKELGIEMVGQAASSWLGVPLTVGDRVLGVMGVQSFDTPRLYDEHDRNLLTAIASQVAIALQNAYLFEESQTRAHREQTLRQIVATVSASENLVENLPVIAEQLRKLVPVDALTLATFVPGEPEFTLFAVGAETDVEHFAQRGTRLPLKDTGPGWVITHQTPRLDADIRQQKPFAEDAQLIAEGLVSRWILPLQIGERLAGTLNLASSQPDAFSEEEHLPILEQVADQMALALERARLLQETQAALAEVRATQRRYMQEQWEDLLSAQPDRAWGYIDGPDGLTVDNEVWTLEIEQAVASSQLTTLAESGDQPTDASSRTALAIPIRIRDQIIGVLDFYDEDHDWTKDDQALVQTLAEQVALALENARLFEQTQNRAQRERLTSEIVSKIRAAGDVHSILETAAEELGRALGVSRTLVRLGEPTDGTPDDGREA